jgi:hypothetical protein
MTELKNESVVTKWLGLAPSAIFVFYAIFFAFTTYFTMYAFRKPFAAASYSGHEFGGFNLKAALVISQILGYALSKYVGIKICSEILRSYRLYALVILIIFAEVSLILFAIVPIHLKVFTIFLNGLPLGMVWGLVVLYLEGRRTSELLLAGLSCSFIVASGVVKDVGRTLMMNFQVSEWWMPAVTGLCFLPFFLTAAWLLDQVPPASQEDISARVERKPMNNTERRVFVLHFLPGLILLVTTYFFLTAYRDFRDNFGIEIFSSLGYGGDLAIFTRTETIVAFGVICCLMLLNLIRNNLFGLIGVFTLMTLGLVLMGASTVLFEAKTLPGFWWMTLVGLGSYLAYVPFGSVLFDRLIAHTSVIGTAVFAIYLADAIGYTGVIAVLLYKAIWHSGETSLIFFQRFTYFMSIGGALLITSGGVYFIRRGLFKKKRIPL